MATKKGQLTQLNSNNELDVLHPETEAGQVIESNAKQFISATEKTKLSGIEEGAEVNVIVGVQVNGSDLTPDANRKVNISMPTDVGADLSYNNQTGVLSLLDKDNNVLGSVDLPLEYLVESGYYDSTTENIVLVLANYELSDPQPTSSTFKQNYYYTRTGSSSPYIYTLASAYDSSATYYNHTRITIPVANLITEFTFDSKYFSTTRVVDGSTIISSSLIGYVDLTGKTPDSYVLTNDEFAEVQKTVCFIKYLSGTESFILYKNYSVPSQASADEVFNSISKSYLPYSQSSYYGTYSAIIKINKSSKKFTFESYNLSTYTTVSLDKELNKKVSQNEIIDNLSNAYVQASPQPTTNTFVTNTYYKRIGGAEPYTYTLASSWESDYIYYVRAVASVDALNSALDNKVTKNNAITGATHTKITYDSKGLVTAGTDLAESDIPALSISKITNLQTNLDAKLDDSQLVTSWSSTVADTNIPSEKLVKNSLDDKVTKNASITGETKTKITYDSKGLVTGGADAGISDITGLQTALDNKLDDSQLKTSWSSTVSDSNIPSEKLVKDSLDNKVEKNSAITGATKTKITYDSKGLVTAGADLAESDIPTLSISKTSGLQTALDNKLDDSQLVTAWSNEVADTNIASEKLVKDTLDTKLTSSTAKVQLTGDVTSSAVSLTNGTASVETTLANSGVTAGTYSAVQVNAKGLVTNGAQIIEVGTSGQTTPSSSLAVGGLFFKVTE